MFAIVALRFMGGQFYGCNDQGVAGRAQCIGSFLNDAGVWAPRVWDKPNYNFDGLGKASNCAFRAAIETHWRG